jgi:coatomer subunit alpha
LAYLTAKTNGLEDVATEILQAAGLSESDIEDVPSFGSSSLGPPPVITSTSNLNWPSLLNGENFFDKALANGHLEGGEEYANGDAGGAADEALDQWAHDEEVGEQEEEEGGWDLDAGGEEAVEVEDEFTTPADEDLGAGASPGIKETELWIRNSPFAADHVAAGSFETAMQVYLTAKSSYRFCSKTLH